MSIFSDLKKGLKIVKAVKEVKEFLNTTHLTKDTKEDLEIIRDAFGRLATRIPAFKTIGDIIIQALK